MRRGIFGVVVAALILNFFHMPPGVAQGSGNSADEIKAMVSQLGTGPKAVVRVTLKDNKKIQGWLSSMADDHFTVIETKSGTATTIPYADVKTVKSLKPSKGLTAGVTLVVVGAAALVFLFAGANH